jgi:hypothetical protein
MLMAFILFMFFLVLFSLLFTFCNLMAVRHDRKATRHYLRSELEEARREHAIAEKWVPWDKGKR